MKQIYIFSGLGTDEKVFRNLDLSDYNTTFIRWLQPLYNETIEAYAQRVTVQVVSRRPILIGLSFGGLIAVEAAKHIETEKIILIASAKSRNEIPFYYRWIGRLGFHRLFPAALLKNPSMLINWFFGVRSRQDSVLLQEILNETDPFFMKWAIDKIVRWKNVVSHDNLLHIHDTADRILPIYFVHCDIRIKGGGHFMTVNKAAELSDKLKELL